MIESELVKIWQSSPNQERAKFEKSLLMIDVQATLDHIHKKIKSRDLMEQAAVLVCIPIFTYYAYTIPFTLTKITSVLIILWGVYMVIRLRNAKKNKPGAFTETYLEYLYKTREYLNVQKRLIDSVLYWYILPVAILVFLFTLGPGIAGRLPTIIKMGIGNVALAVTIYYLNKRAVQKELIPRLEKIDELINALEKL